MTQAMTNKTKVLIVDDHPFFRHGLKTVLQTMENLYLIGEAENGMEALELADKLNPDLIILDLSMPELNGFQVLEKLQHKTAMRKIIMTSFNDQAYLDRTFELGAHAFILKESGKKELTRCFEQVIAGKKYSSSLTHDGRKQPNLIPNDTAEILAVLTHTELIVMYHLGDFLTSKEIAKKMHISYRTVQNHRTNIKVKIDLAGMHQLTKLAQKYSNEIRAMIQ